MAGRDDPRQKGYDVAVEAAKIYLRKRKNEELTAQFLFFPIEGDEGKDGLDFLREFVLADEFKEKVLAFIGRWDAGFGAAQRAAAYGLMPSLYEPFGMAHEFYLQGSVGIGRATGGNLQQIVPLRATTAFSHAVANRCNRFHAFSTNPSGILYREKDDVPTAVADWAAINKGRYAEIDPTGRLRERSTYPLFHSMAMELELAISEGVSIYNTKSDLYYRMLCAGIRHVEQSFSWDRAARDYVRYLC